MHLLSLVLIVHFVDVFYLNLHFLVFEKFLQSDYLDVFLDLIYDNLDYFRVGDIHCQFHYFLIMDSYLNRYIFIDMNQESKKEEQNILKLPLKGVDIIYKDQIHFGFFNNLICKQFLMLMSDLEKMQFLAQRLEPRFLSLIVIIL